MKIYRARDNYRGKERWHETMAKALADANLWACVLDAENTSADFSGSDWVEVEEFDSKESLILALNAGR